MTKTESIVQPLEFQERASSFSAEVSRIMGNFPRLDADVEDHTAILLAMKDLAVIAADLQNSTNQYRRLFADGYRQDTDSTKVQRISIVAWAPYKKDLKDFGKKVKRMAKGYSGVDEMKELNIIDKAKSEPDRKHRYEMFMLYAFSG